MTIRSKAHSCYITVFMNLLLVVTCRSRAAVWVSPPVRQISSWPQRDGAVMVAAATRPCQSRQNQHKQHGALLFQGPSSSPPPPPPPLAAAAAARNDGYWCFQTSSTIHKSSQRSRPLGSSIHIACAKMMSTRGSDGSMNSISRDDDDGNANGFDSTFSPGDQILVKVISFGPLGASVKVIGKSHDRNDIMIDKSSETPALAKGMILQIEIDYFQHARGNIDVVQGEVLPAYVEQVRRDETSSTGENHRCLDICLRPFGAKAKALELSDLILQRLAQEDSRNAGRLEIGYRSTPEEILAEFPGISKKTFKTAVYMLEKLGKIQQQHGYSISIMQPEKQHHSDEQQQHDGFSSASPRGNNNPCLLPVTHNLDWTRVLENPTFWPFIMPDVVERSLSSDDTVMPPPPTASTTASTASASATSWFRRLFQ